MTPKITREQIDTYLAANGWLPVDDAGTDWLRHPVGDPVLRVADRAEYHWSGVDDRAEYHWSDALVEQFAREERDACEAAL